MHEQYPLLWNKVQALFVAFPILYQIERGVNGVSLLLTKQMQNTEDPWAWWSATIFDKFVTRHFLTFCRSPDSRVTLSLYFCFQLLLNATCTCTKKIRVWGQSENRNDIFFIKKNIKALNTTEYIISSTVNPTGGPWDSDRMAKGSVAQKRLGTTALEYRIRMKD